MEPPSCSSMDSLPNLQSPSYFLRFYFNESFFNQFNESLTYVFGKAAWHIPNTLAISLTFTFFVEIIRLINYTFSCLCWVDLTVTSFEFKTKPKASIFWEGKNTDFSVCTWKPKLVNWLSTHVHVCIVQKNPQKWKNL